jgi:hypothetical protein
MDTRRSGQLHAPAALTPGRLGEGQSLSERCQETNRGRPVRSAQLYQLSYRGSPWATDNIA